MRWLSVLMECVLVYRANLTVGLGYFIHIEGLFVGGGV